MMVRLPTPRFFKWYLATVSQHCGKQMARYTAFLSTITIHGTFLLLMGGANSCITCHTHEVLFFLPTGASQIVTGAVLVRDFWTKLYVHGKCMARYMVVEEFHGSKWYMVEMVRFSENCTVFKRYGI